jgi:hypothetical protein
LFEEAKAMSTAYWRTMVAAAFVTGIATASPSRADVIPAGIQTDIPLATITGAWGWTLIYRGDYGVFDLPISTAFAGVGTYVMLGAIQDGSSNVALLAAAPTGDVLSFTPRDTTRSSNGAEWYYNAWSMGFAPPGEPIEQGSADILDGNLRLSWHTGVGLPGFNQNPNVAPLDIDGGYRVGDTLGLNLATSWDRVIFTLTVSPAAEVPEPASLLLFGIGLAGIAAERRRRSRR